MPHLTLLNRMRELDESAVGEWAARLDSARSEDETRTALAGLLAESAARAQAENAVRRWLPRGESASRPEVVPLAVSRAVRRMKTPAYVQGRLMDVLESNSQARSLTDCFEPGTNLALSIFLSEAIKELGGDWEAVTASMARYLLYRAEREPADRGLQALVGELAVRSARFRRLWAEEIPAPQRSSIGEWRHPIVGQLRLTREKTLIEGTDGMMLVVYRADPGSLSEVALDLLETLRM
ncbi:MmyB family transcriptional regulator [Leifsonia sp. 22587]|uniref:MmyB family transcriptional regulator n=1 Tax=Leifsonia sp. 22587 TaxID=3453946 RepID=UPI003F865D86